MYFFSALDPNFRVKGSRDPLGFQSIWSRKGRKVIAHLSTVSQDLTDFMILSYATFFFQSKDDRQSRDSRFFVNFFLKFEQACSFARMLYHGERSFNGGNFVSSNIEDRKKSNVFSCSLSPRDTILSNQRAYGIYGKYIRPFRDIGITGDKSFSEIMEEALQKTDRKHLMAIIERLIGEKEVKLSGNDLEIIAKLIGRPTEGEKELFKKYILTVPDRDHLQNNLFQVLKNSNITDAEYNLYSFIHAVTNDSDAITELRNALKEIENTEKVLYPLNQGFAYMLNSSFWKNKDIIKDNVLDGIKSVAEKDFLQEDDLNNLLEIFTLDKKQKIGRIVERNKKICERRGYRAWIEKENGGYRVLYGENAKNIDSIDYETGFEYPYFIPTYVSLFNQIERN